MCSTKVIIVKSYFSVGPFHEWHCCFKRGCKGLNPSKALGPDELHPRVLKEFATELGPVFVHLFQSLLTRVKSPKNGLLQIYVPSIKRVTGLSHLIIVPSNWLVYLASYSNITAHLDEYKLLSDRQHAFRKRHSCETQLTTVINDWAKILDNGGQVDTFILDFEKAFGTPSHEQTVWLWHRWEDTEMDRFFSVLQTTASSFKRSKIGFGPGFVWCPTGHYPWSLVVFFIH